MDVLIKITTLNLQTSNLFSDGKNKFLMYEIHFEWKEECIFLFSFYLPLIFKIDEILQITILLHQKFHLGGTKIS